MRSIIYPLFLLPFLFTGFSGKKSDNHKFAVSSTVKEYISKDNKPPVPGNLHTDYPPVTAEDLVAFAKTLIGTPYLYASTDPAKGLDCSGFVYYVTHHFGLSFPRSSVDFTDYGTTIDREDSRPGDFILFTGTDSTTGIVGHMGIITKNEGGNIQFIHSSSGKAMGVTISGLTGYYESRFVKVIRVLDA